MRIQLLTSYDETLLIKIRRKSQKTAKIFRVFDTDFSLARFYEEELVDWAHSPMGNRLGKSKVPLRRTRDIKSCRGAVELACPSYHRFHPLSLSSFSTLYRFIFIQQQRVHINCYDYKQQVSSFKRRGWWAWVSWRRLQQQWAADQHSSSWRLYFSSSLQQWRGNHHC